MKIDFIGEPTHASQPSHGKNPSAAMMDVVKAIPKFFSLTSFNEKPMCTITHIEAGKRSFGIAAGKGSLWMTCRSWYSKDMDAAIEQLAEYAKKRGEKDGIKVRVSFREKFASTENDPKMTKRIIKAAKELGYPVFVMDDPIAGSEDFGAFLKNAKGAMFMLCAGEDWPMIHTAEYDYPDKILEPTVELFKTLAYQKY
jgi:metal-dependent amidase/aminoacylase/carboxypeptidase family protein